MKRPRPHYGNVFEYDRILNVFFYTSNTEKLLQARLLFMRHGYELRHFRGKKEPYDEDYQLGTAGLLNRAIEQVKAEFGVRSIFFVEDTSVRIEGLSDVNDFPGPAIKEWFPQVTFEALDKQLRESGNDRRAKVNSDIPDQSRTVVLAVGARCSGKTTFSDYMANYESVRVYEASTVLREIGEETGVIPSNSTEALEFLSEVGWDSVARKIADYIDKDDSRLSVVTGLRTPEELLFLKRRFPAARIILIDADQRIRFERHIRRARDGTLTDMRAFSREDDKQKEFGTLRIANDIAEITILNDGTRDQYSKKIEEALDLISGTPEKLRLQSSKSLSELHRSLKALLTIGIAATCEEISDLTARLGSPVRKYNTNRALKAVPEFARRLDNKGERLRYQPTNRSLSLLRLLDLLTNSESDLINR